MVVAAVRAHGVLVLLRMRERDQHIQICKHYLHVTRQQGSGIQATFHTDFLGGGCSLRLDVCFYFKAFTDPAEWLAVLGCDLTKTV